MVDPVDLKHLIDRSRPMDQSAQNARVKPGSGQQSFARELNQQSELSESQVQDTPQTDEVKITEQEHKEGQQKKHKKRKKKEEETDQERIVAEEKASGKNIDATVDADSNGSGDSEKHNVDIKI